MERAVEFANYWDQSDVWSILARAQLQKEMVKEAIGSFIKADDATAFVDVIAASRNAAVYEDLILYLKMARVKVRPASTHSRTSAPPPPSLAFHSASPLRVALSCAV